MGRFLAGVASALLLMAAGLFWWKSLARADDPLPPAPGAPSMLLAPQPVPAPPAAERSREEKRFDRYDKDRSGMIVREEYLASRRKAWAKLDLNGDGRLSFEEWSARTLQKFSDADADKSASLTRKEFAKTRVIRKATAKCACPNLGNAEDD